MFKAAELSCRCGSETRQCWKVT